MTLKIIIYNDDFRNISFFILIDFERVIIIIVFAYHGLQGIPVTLLLYISKAHNDANNIILYCN
jgi:hypothetical protein